ncbi:hypothetical protein ACFVH6_43625 [Spirillospora sp. NPDC127200]
MKTDQRSPRPLSAVLIGLLCVAVALGAAALGLLGAAFSRPGGDPTDAVPALLGTGRR